MVAEPWVGRGAEPPRATKTDRTGGILRGSLHFNRTLARARPKTGSRAGGHLMKGLPAADMDGLNSTSTARD